MTDMEDDYVELHAASAFSFLEGGSLPETLIERAAELGMSAMALTDCNGLYGAPRFQAMASQKGVKAHVGAEIIVKQADDNGTLSHLPLLCTSQPGYQNLCQLITRFKMREPTKQQGAALIEDLREFAGGLICLTGGAGGVLARALATGGEAQARIQLEELMRIYGRGNVYVELQRHGQREEEHRNQTALALAKSLNLPVVATNGIRYASQPDREIADLFTCIRHGTELDRAGSILTTNSQRYLRSPVRMKDIFRDVPDAIVNTRLLSSRLDFKLTELGYTFPEYEVPAGETMESFLRQRVSEGVTSRYGIKQSASLLARAKKQVERELKLIGQLEFTGYFLIVWDIVQYCQRHGILVQGRGSAANSAVCYALGITAVDPIGMDLLFERFLSESRNEWPDIDLDLPSGEKREGAIQYIYERYGQLGAAMTANVITYRGKSAAREVGKALGFKAETLERIAGMVGQFEWRGPTDNMLNNFHIAGLDLKHPRIAKYLELCLRIQNMPRHLGQHSGGMVVSRGRLNCVVPLERASMAGRTVVQWDKDDCSEMKIIKIDVLGLGMMAVLKDCLDLIPSHYGHNVDFAQVPEGDEETYDTLRRGDTVGMFQVESRAQMASLPRNNPKKFYDLVVQVAIIRPGPIVGKMMHPYMQRRQGKEKITYLDDRLIPVLQRTLGIPLFQEQLLSIAMVLAGFTGSEAEELRKAVGMRRSMGRMKQLEVKLRAGMQANGISAQTQDQIIQNISSFALYGFPESHAASFAMLAYASAYFKVKYLAAFTCALLNNQPMGFYSTAVIVKDAQRHGLRFAPVDIQKSMAACSLERGADGMLSLRLGLCSVRGVTAYIAASLVAERRNGDFVSTSDVMQRVPQIRRGDLVQMARVGALNYLEGVTHRRDALWQVEEVARQAGPLLHSLPIAPVASPLESMTTDQRMISDYSGMGLTTGPHPMTHRREDLCKSGMITAEGALAIASGSTVRVAGCVIARQRPGTAHGFIFLSLEDETGIANIIVRPQLYEEQKAVVTRAKFLWVKGKLQNEKGVVHIVAETVEPLIMKPLCLKSHDFH